MSGDAVHPGYLTPYVSREEWNGLIDMYSERAVFIDQQINGLGRELAEKVDVLHKALTDAGYIGKDGEAGKTHPLAKRVDDLERRLSLEVVAHALSKRLRRTIVLGVLVACLVAAGFSAFTDMEISHNHAETKQGQATMQNIARLAEQNHQISQVNHTLLQQLNNVDQKLAALDAKKG